MKLRPLFSDLPTYQTDVKYTQIFPSLPKLFPQNSPVLYGTSILHKYTQIQHSIVIFILIYYPKIFDVIQNSINQTHPKY